jgi:transcriptional regulator with XRE-family HTH domain
MEPASLGDTIRQARQTHGLGLRQLARLVDVSPPQVMRWEAGDATPSPVFLAALAEQLELRASDLFRLAGAPIPTDLATLPAMLRADYDLPPEAIAEIEAHIATVAGRYRGRTRTSHN